VVAVHGDSDASSNKVQSTNHLFLLTSSFWSPLHLTLVPAVLDQKPSNNDEETETVTGVFHLTIKNTTHDTQKLAVLSISENMEKEKHIVWQSTTKEST
jgi:hypothetical protein